MADDIDDLMAKKKGPLTSEDVERGRRFIQLREYFGLTQEEWADRSGGEISRVVANQIERGKNKVSGGQTLSGIANAFGLKVDDVIAYRDGAKSLDEIVRIASLRSGTASSAALAPSAPTPEQQGASMGVAIELNRSALSRFPRLNACLAYHENRWSPATVAAAFAGAFGDEDLAGPEWAKALDALEAVLKHVAVEHGRGRTGPKPKVLRP